MSGDRRDRFTWSDDDVSVICPNCGSPDHGMCAKVRMVRQQIEEKSSLDDALADLRSIGGFEDAALTGDETPLPNGETRLEYTTKQHFDLPLLVLSPDGTVRVETWSYGMGLGPE